MKLREFHGPERSVCPNLAKFGSYLATIWPNLAMKFFLVDVFEKITYKSNPTYLLNFLFDPVKKNWMAKFGQIVAKYYPNLAKFGLTDLSYPWNSLIFIQNPSNGIKRTFLYAEFLRIPYGPSE